MEQFQSGTPRKSTDTFHLNFFASGGIKLQKAAATRSMAEDKFFMFKGRIPPSILKDLSLRIALSTWIRREAIFRVSIICLEVSTLPIPFFHSRVNGGMFRHVKVCSF